MFHVKHDGAAMAPAAAHAVFGRRIETAARYVEILATTGVERGLIGPRESDRLWDRHVLNSAVVEELIPPGARVADIGSGAGLPGIPVAIARPDIRVALIEPLLRRATFLGEVVEALDLSGVTVVRGRAEDPDIRGRIGECDAVISRAVAALDKVARWSAPLIRPGGQMLAMKGDRAEAELEEHRDALTALGLTGARVVKCGAENTDPPTTVVVAGRVDSGTQRSAGGRGRGRNR